MEKLNKSILLIIICFLFFSCKDKKEYLHYADIKIPIDLNKWDVRRLQGVDTEELELVSKSKNDTLKISYGYSTFSSFERYQYAILDNKENRDFRNEELRRGALSIVRSEIDSQQGVHLLNYFYYDTICSHVAKVMLRKNINVFEKRYSQYGVLVYDVEENQKLTISTSSNNRYMVDEILNLIEDMKNNCN